MSTILEFLKDFINKNKFGRRLILLTLDSLILISVFKYCVFISLRNSDLYFAQIDIASILLIVIAIPLNILTGQYKGLNKYVGSYSVYLITIRNILSIFLFLLISKYLNIVFIPFHLQVLFLFLVSGFTGLTRFILRDLLIKFFNK